MGFFGKIKDMLAVEPDDDDRYFLEWTIENSIKEDHKKVENWKPKKYNKYYHEDKGPRYSYYWSEVYLIIDDSEGEEIRAHYASFMVTRKYCEIRTKKKKMIVPLDRARFIKYSRHFDGISGYGQNGDEGDEDIFVVIIGKCCKEDFERFKKFKKNKK